MLPTTATVIGIDLGGTNIRAARIRQGQMEAQHRQRVPHGEDVSPVLEAICACIDQIFTPQVQAIGIGVPGLVDHTDGTVFDIQNIPGWGRVPLRSFLQQRYGVPVAIDNDANCFVLAELHYGAAQGYQQVVGLALGTGMGAGLVSNGKLHSGLHSGAGELGAVPYRDMDYEAYCSGQFLARKGHPDGQQLAQLAAQGDANAAYLFAQLGYHLAHAILLCTYAFAPQLVVLGGSVATSREYFHNGMLATMQSQRKLGTLPEIRYSQLPEAALMGAAGLCFDKLQHSTTQQTV